MINLLSHTMRMRNLLLTACHFIIAVDSLQFVPYPEDATLTMVELLSKYGYPSQVEFVTTPDGYILKLYRIPYGRECGPEKTRKTPVIFFHGMEGSSYDNVISGPQKAIGYLLADNCYDVWLPNTRGTFESPNHQWLNPNSHSYWRFSWHEMGIYDTPTVVDHVLARTKQKQVHLIGHSQGGTQIMVYGAMLPEEGNRKIKSTHSFGPTVFLGHIRNQFFRFLSQNVQFFQTIQSVSGPSKFFPLVSQFVKDNSVTCSIQNGFLNMCGNSIFLLLGYDPEQFNATIIQNLIARDPAGASIMQFIHFGQLIKSGHFRQYDYSYNLDGSNLEVYGQPNPPDYEVENIETPMFLYYGDEDLLAVKEDIMHLAAITKNSTVIRVPFDRFSHIDFIAGNDARRYLYQTVLDNLNKFEQ